jgi:MFS family permease
MILTILLYSLFTGLSSFSVGVWDFAFYRFLTGLGVGGEFAVGVALLAETMPDRARPFTLGLLQAFSAGGNITAAFLYMYLGNLQQTGFFKDLTLGSLGPITPWRVLFIIGTVPALLSLLIRRRLQEPERWKAAVKTVRDRHPLSTFRELFRHPTWRKHALLGLLLAFSGVVGLWAIGFYSPELTRHALQKTFEQEGVTDPAELQGKLAVWASWTGLMVNIGAFFGMFAFSWATSYMGRRKTFAIALLAAMVSTASAFLFLRQRSDIFWMIPIMGFCQLSLFGGYAIYFPELFPTRLRSTGTSFCYNIGRFVAAVGPVFLGMLTRYVFTGSEGFRYAGITMCSVFALGLLALPFLPETKGQPLPDDTIEPDLDLKKWRAMMAVNAPDWLKHHDCELKPSRDGHSWLVYLGKELAYVVAPVPAVGAFSCKVTQTINGKRLDHGGTFPTLEDAARGGLEDLRKALGW